MPPERPDVSFELGSIKGQLDTIIRTLSENRTADAQYRTGIRAEMAAQTTAISEVKTDMALAKEAIGDMKPKVESTWQRATMSKGASNLAIILMKFGNMIWAGAGAIIAVLLERWLRGSPH